MNVVLIIPTGIGAEIGGHNGDANPIAKLIGSLCDTLITHPNVVNASDINEMPENTLYVEGSILDRFLRKEIALKRVFQNKILVAVNSPAHIDTINAVSAARATIGADISIIKLETPLKMIAHMKNGCASGDVIGWEDLVEQVSQYDFDALAIATPIDVDRNVALKYLRDGGINPWGGVEAKASKFIATAIDKPTAHAPFGDSLSDFNAIVDPRMAAEMVSTTYLHSVLKGLHKAPQISLDHTNLNVDDVHCLITPMGCVGEPHWACLKANIPIIAVKENKTCLNDKIPEEFILVENYLEAAGLIACMKSGIYWPSVRRPLEYTNILN
jgi:hypothetical protein